MRSKCLCIKDYTSPLNNKFPEFQIGEWYEYTDQKFVSREYPEGFNVQFYKGNYLFLRKNQDPLASKGYGVFKTHFKTIKDIRKEKLKQINGSILL